MQRKREQKGAAWGQGGFMPAGRSGARLAAVLLALLLLLAGCGETRPEQPVRPAKAAGRAAPQTAAPIQNTGQGTGRKALAAPRLVFEPELPWHVRAARTLRAVYINLPQVPVYKLGMFDLTGDGVPELMEFSISAWTASCFFYDLSGQKPLPLGGISWPPLEMNEGWVWSKPVECGTAWRFDIPYGHGFEGGAITDMIFPAEDGLHFVDCWEDISVKDMTDWVPYYWRYTVRHWLWKDGECQFSRTEEELHFAPDEDLSQEDPERAARLLPASEMEKVLEGSLYRQLLNDGWVKTAEPWLTEDDLEPFYGSRVGIDTAERCRRLYETWETRQGQPDAP